MTKEQKEHDAKLLKQRQEVEQKRHDKATAIYETMKQTDAVIKVETRPEPLMYLCEPKKNRKLVDNHVIQNLADRDLIYCSDQNRTWHTWSAR